MLQVCHIQSSPAVAHLCQFDDALLGPATNFRTSAGLLRVCYQIVAAREQVLVQQLFDSGFFECHSMLHCRHAKHHHGLPPVPCVQSLNGSHA